MMKLKRQFDYFLVINIVLANILSGLMIYSVTEGNTLFIKHLFILVIGWIVFFIAAVLDYRIWLKFSKLIYAFSILLLIIVLLTEPIRTSKAWFSIEGISFQPAELAKFSTILVMAEYLALRKNTLNNSLKPLLISGLFISIVVVLILNQPDLGTALLFFPPYLAMLYIAGISLFRLTIILLLAVFVAFFTLLFSFLQIHYSKTLFDFIKPVDIISLFAIICILLMCLVKLINIDKKIKLKYIFTVCVLIIVGLFLSASINDLLADYQKKRIVVFLNTNLDPLGVGYNIIQSKIAIGSGMILGRGLMQSMQAKLGFLPEVQTDFIFSLLAEELGFIGTTLLISIFFSILYKGLQIGYNCNNTFARLLTIGLITSFITQVIINISVTLGILPTTGIPLPLMSSGGSSLIITMLSLGIINSIIHRHKND